VIVFNGLELNPNMVWTDALMAARVEDRVVRTVGQKELVFTRTLPGMSITLLAIEDQGWLTVLQVKQLREWSMVKGASFTLQIGSYIFTVRFDNQNGDAVSFQTIIPRPVPQDEDFCVGSLKLKVVS